MDQNKLTQGQLHHQLSQNRKRSRSREEETRRTAGRGRRAPNEIALSGPDSAMHVIRQHHSMLSVSPTISFLAHHLASTHEPLPPCLRSLPWLLAGLWPASPLSALLRAASWPPPGSRRLASTRAPSVTPSSTYGSLPAISFDQTYMLTTTATGSPRCHVWCFPDRWMVNITPSPEYPTPVPPVTLLPLI